MANNNYKKNKNNSNSRPVFRKYDSMTKGEKEAFYQGAKTVENKVKEGLGLKPKRRKKVKWYCKIHT